MQAGIAQNLRNLTPAQLNWMFGMMGRLWFDGCVAGSSYATIPGIPALRADAPRTPRTTRTTRRIRTRAAAQNGNIPAVPEKEKDAILTFAKEHATWGINPLATKLGVTRTQAKKFADAMVGIGQLGRQGKAYKLAVAH